MGLILCALLLVLTGTALLLGAALPNGGQILYQYGQSSLWLGLFDVDRGLRQTLLTDASAPTSGFAWSPDGQMIAFAANLDGDSEIYTLRADGRDLQRITFDPALDYNPVWSPDGREIRFWSHREGGYKALYAVNRAGGGLHRLTNATHPNSDFRITMAPDGQQVAYVSFRDGNAELYIRPSFDAELQRLTDNQVLDYNPAWSPDSRMLAFWSHRDAGAMALYLIDAHGGAAHLLSPTLPARADLAASAAWSAGGDQIAFASAHEGADALYALDVGSGQVRRLGFIGAHMPLLAWRPG
jgi:TolB protein